MSISLNAIHDATLQAVNYAAFHKIVNAAHCHHIAVQDHHILIINAQRQLIAIIMLPHLDHTGFCMPLSYYVADTNNPVYLSRTQLLALWLAEKITRCNAHLKLLIKKLNRASQHFAAGASPKPPQTTWTTLRLTG